MMDGEDDQMWKRIHAALRRLSDFFYRHCGGKHFPSDWT